MLKSLFIKKTVDEMRHDAESKKDALESSLTAWDLTTLGIGAIIGAGIFVFAGEAAANYAGPGVVFSILFAAILCVFSALCYAEFASLIPVAGGAYSYCYATLGEVVAWTIGWGLTLEYLFSSASVAVGWSGYFTSLAGDFGFMVPTTLSNAPFIYDAVNGWTTSGAWVNLPAMLIVALIGAMIATGIDVAARVNNVIVVIKMGVIFLFLGCGAAYINLDNLQPFIPENTGTFGSFGYSGVLRGAGVVFFAFIGFDALSTLAQEARNPQKDLPRAMIGSLAFSAFVYVLIALVLTGLVSYKLLGVPAPFPVAINAMGPNFVWLRYVANFGILIGLTSVILVMLLGQTRIFYSMAHDGLLPKIFGTVHHKYHTPFANTLILTAVCMLLSGLFPVGILGQLVSMGTLLAFAIVCFGVLVLRYQQPDLKRPFKVPFFPWVPIAGVATCLLQMIAMPAVTWVQLIAWLALGYVIYFTYGIRNSLLRKNRRNAG
jgi:APA family basic amino acid/polyamine antiporter